MVTTRLQNDSTLMSTILQKDCKIRFANILQKDYGRNTTTEVQSDYKMITKGLQKYYKRITKG